MNGIANYMDWYSGTIPNNVVETTAQGSTFPGAHRHMPLDSAVGWAPRFFRLGAQYSMYDNQKSCF